MPVFAKNNLDTNGQGCQEGLSNSGESIAKDFMASGGKYHILTQGQKGKRSQGFTLNKP